jgi:glycogen synthase
MTYMRLLGQKVSPDATDQAMHCAMKVLMTTDSVGGVWNYSLELIAGLKAHNVAVLLAIVGPEPAASQWSELHKLRGTKSRTYTCRLEWMDEPWTDVQSTIKWLIDIGKDFAPDIVHLNSYSYAKAEWQVPVLVVGHSCVLSWWREVKQSSAPPSSDLYKRNVTAGLQAADLVIAPSRAMLAGLHDHYDWNSLETVIPNGISADKFLPREKKNFIFAIGRVWDEAKNLSILNAVAERSPWPILIAGDTQLSSTATFAKSSGTLRMLGRLTNRKVRQMLSVAAIYIHPARYEPFGLSVLEAALSSCCLVLADIKSLRENWDGVAIFVSPDDDACLIESVEKLIGNPSLREEYGQKARERGRSFAAWKMTARYLKAYNYLLAQRRAGTWQDAPSSSRCEL